MDRGDQPLFNAGTGKMFDKPGILWVSQNIKKQMRASFVSDRVELYTFWCTHLLNETPSRLLPRVLQFRAKFLMAFAGRMFPKYLVMPLARSVVCVSLALVFIVSGWGQDVRPVPYTSQEVSESDGIPVLLKHLPDWENRRASARLIHNASDLKQAVGDRPETDAIEFVPGTEAVTADYEQGKLLIVEYAAPQPSIETDQRISQAITTAGTNTYTRRIGNYNVVVFDASSSRAANGLIDQVKYEKQITWLGSNPFAISAERAFVITTSDIFFSTLMVIVGGVLFSILGGLAVGYLFFIRREKRREGMVAFSDAGGMTRLNLDDLTPDLASDRLLRE